YSENAELTEYFSRVSAFGNEYLTILSIVHDPMYLASDFITSAHFKREPDDSNWNPTPCRTAPPLAGHAEERLRRLVLVVALAPSPLRIAFAQVDFRGAGDHPGLFGHEDFNDGGSGPEIGDFMGLPLNEAGTRKAESYSGSWLSVPEHKCTPH